MDAYSEQEKETVGNLIPKPEIQYVKRTRYVSKHIDRIRAETKSGKCSHRTLGVPQVPLRLPGEYLKKKSRVEYKVTVQHEHIRAPNYQRSLPKWQTVKVTVKDKLAILPEDPVTAGRINFRKHNICEVKKSRPVVPKKRFVDTRCGSVHDLCPSGLYPIYIHRKKFGTVPKYLTRQRMKSGVKLEDEHGGKLSTGEKQVAFTAQKDYCDKFQLKKSLQKHMDDHAAVKKESLCQRISDEERQQLLEGMKMKWDEMMKQFQSLPFLADTPPKRQRKTIMERELLKLEKDIAIVERHPYIYTYSDDSEDE